MKSVFSALKNFPTCVGSWAQVLVSQAILQVRLVKTSWDYTAKQLYKKRLYSHDAYTEFGLESTEVGSCESTHWNSNALADGSSWGMSPLV